MDVFAADLRSVVFQLRAWVVDLELKNGHLGGDGLRPQHWQKVTWAVDLEVNNGHLGGFHFALNIGQR